MIRVELVGWTALRTWHMSHKVGSTDFINENRREKKRQIS
jgi:hypothetical protein